MKKKQYPNTLKGFRQWVKDHPHYEKVETHKLDDYYVEFGLSYFGGLATAFVAVRKYDEEKKSFVSYLVEREETVKLVSDHIDKLISYAVRNKADSILLPNGNFFRIGQFVKKYKLAELEAMPVQETYHFDNLYLEFKDKDFGLHWRLLKSRMTVEDGAPYNNQVTVERWNKQAQQWEAFKEYQAI